MSSTSALADLPLLERRTLADTVHEAICDLLVSGKLAPGDRLSLRETAAALGVSVMPVREAVSRIASDGALEVAPNRVIRVPRLTVSAFRELAEVRMAVEGFAAARAAEHRDEAALTAIRRAEAAFRDNALSGKPDQSLAVVLNRDVHFTIYAACGLPSLCEIITRLWLKAGPVLNLDLRAHPERLIQGFALRRHADAMAAIESGDGPAAQAAIAGDIAEAAEFIVARGGLQAD